MEDAINNTIVIRFMKLYSIELIYVPYEIFSFFAGLWNWN